MYSTCDVDIISQRYKFYLSFENSLCEDYVTEKLWRIVNNPVNAIPIVLGRPRYSRYLPRGTYIDIRDFKSPKDLAKHLDEINNNDSMYNNIVREKLSLKCESEFAPGQTYACRLCKYAHRTRGHVTKVPNILDFWGFSRRCIEPKEFYPGVWDGFRKVDMKKLKYKEKYMKFKRRKTIELL